MGRKIVLEVDCVPKDGQVLEWSVAKNEFVPKYPLAYYADQAKKLAEDEKELDDLRGRVSTLEGQVKTLAGILKGRIQK